jgi:ligand-binding sensor domain-containing protein/signal transduction histidine kinase
MRKGRRQVVLSRAILLACCACSFVSHHVTQYARTAWTRPGRLFVGNLYATAQKPDAIPRFGWESGLFRFDGVRRRRRQAPAGQHLPGENISDLTIKAGLAGHAEGRADSTPRRLQNSRAQGGDAPVRDLKFTHLTTNDGLTQDNIVASLQDHRGFMWFATNGGGLHRYDGNTFVVYQNSPDDPNTLSANSTQSLIEDDHGELWIGTWGGGLDKFDPTTERFTHYRYNPDNPNSISGDRVKSLARDSRGYLWVGTIDAGLNKLDPATGTFTHYRTDSTGQSIGAVNSIVEDSLRDIWFAGSRGLFYVSPQTGQIIRPPATMDSLAAADYLHLHEDKAGNLWMLADSPIVALVKYDHRTERFTEYPFAEGAIGIVHSTIVDDGQNGLWVASSLGLYHFDLQTEQFTYCFRHDDTNPDSLSDNKVVSIQRDRAGLLWIGTESGGLNILDFAQEQFGSYRHRPGNPSSLSPGVVTAMHQDRNGILWVGFLPRALDRFDRKTGQITHYVPGSESKNALGEGSFLNGIYGGAEGHLWLGGWGALDRFDERSGQFKHYQHKPDDPRSLLSHEILCIYEDRSGRLWVGQVGGLSRLDPETDTFINYRNGPAGLSGLGDTSVTAIYQDRSGTLWFGTWMGTLSRFDDKANTLVNYKADSRNAHKISSSGIWHIHEDRAGTLWLGTLDGLYRFNRENETLTQYTVNQGLPSGVIQCILDDRSGRLWLSTKKGISRFDPHNGTFRNYDAYDGLQSNDFAVSSCYEDDRNGEMLFGGSNGITAFFPERIRDNPYVPPVVLTSFRIFNRPVSVSATSVLKKAIPYVDSLTLSYRDSVFSFEFAALSYGKSHKNRYRYKLENLEPGWNEVGSKQRLATYTNLDPGKYLFRAQGSNSDGVWNEEGVSLTILITPPWWKTNWFRALLAIVLVTLIWLAYQLRLRQLAAQFNLGVEERIRERTRIARDLHDTLLQSFQGALLRFQSVANVLATRPEEARARLERALDQAEAAITEGRDAVQGLRSSAVTVNDLAKGIAAFGAELTGSQATVDPPAIAVKVEGASRDLNPAVREEAYRIAGEALRNAVKHARARQITVTIHYEARQLRLTVRDDGKGMDEETRQRQQTAGHFGLRGMRERATFVRGRLEVRTAIGSGSEIELRVPGATAYVSARTSRWLHLLQRR